MAISDFKRFERRVRELLPDARLDVSAPAAEDGYWFLDVMKPGVAVVARWRVGESFGLATPDKDTYSGGVDELYSTVEEAARRVYELISGRKRTVRPEEVTLRKLRAERGLSQVQLAGLLGVSQPAVSRAEDRVSRMQIDTLQTIARAMGGKLVILIEFKEGESKQLKLEEELTEA